MSVKVRIHIILGLEMCERQHLPGSEWYNATQFYADCHMTIRIELGGMVRSFRNSHEEISVLSL